MIYLKVKKVLTKVSSKYADFEDVFSPKLAAKLPKYTRIYDYAIELADNQQPSHSPINNLDLVALETLKIYIKNNLANNFIKSSKCSTGAPFFFTKKLDTSLSLFVDYQGPYNLTIKIQYLLSFVRKLLDWLDRVRQFTQLNLTNTNYQMRIGEDDK